MTPITCKVAARCVECGGPVAILEDVRECSSCGRRDPDAWRDPRNGEWWDVRRLIDAFYRQAQELASVRRERAHLAGDLEAATVALEAAVLAAASSPAAADKLRELRAGWPMVAAELELAAGGLEPREPASVLDHPGWDDTPDPWPAEAEAPA